MLSDLFSGDTSDKMNVTFHSTVSNKPFAPSKRNSTNLCGIINQGATCYLNTLIQTLLHTPEFRENLFSLGPEELGLIPSTSGSKLRVIPIELQRLFGELLHLDQNACSTNRLTDSFGWTNNEELQQHDVQELNRILFNAIEQSLVNTKQSKLIQDLYRGTCVNKIKCLSCSTEFQREEEFLDLPITVQGLDSLQMSLMNSFIMRENMDGNNQYRCEKCDNQYRDAEKYCQLKHLPPILTFSLLRFTYDLTTFQRIKETRRFEFPLELDLSEYMEDTFKQQIDKDYTMYELYSVIIHSGSAYGGHYRTYIKDLSGIGEWRLEENDDKNPANRTSNQSTEVHTSSSNEICLICCDDVDEAAFTDGSNELVNLDYLKYEKPIELLKAFIYNKHKYEPVKIELICGDLTKTTGMSWNKSYKSKYGPIEKFLRKNDDVFELVNGDKFVKLKESLSINIVASSRYSSEKTELIESCLNEVEETKEELNKCQKENEQTNVASDQNERWFDFNDSHITAIKSTQISKQFEGKESAYMLFYRRVTSVPRSIDILPDWLSSELSEANSRIIAKRVECDNIKNMLSVDCFFETDFYLDMNVLNMHHQFEKQAITLSLDKRTTCIKDLKELLVSQCTDEKSSAVDQMRKEACLNVLFDDSPTYWLLCQRVDTSVSSTDMQSTSSGRFSYYIKCILDDQDKNVYDAVCNNMSNKLLILSKHVDVWPIGEIYEPIRLLIKYFDEQYHVTETSYTFAKCTLIKDLKETVSNDYWANRTVAQTQLKLTLIRKSNKVESQQVLNVYDDSKSLGEMSINNGDFITIEESLSMAQMASKQNVQGSNQSNNRTIVQSTIDSLGSSTTSKTENPLLVKMNDITVINCMQMNPTSSEDSDNYLKASLSDSELLSNLKLMAVSSFGISSDQLDTCHLRFIDTDEYESQSLRNKILTNYKIDKPYSMPGVCMHEDARLEEALELLPASAEKKLTFLLSPARAPSKSNNEITIKCLAEETGPHMSNTKGETVEIIICLNSIRVGELTHAVVDALQVPTIEETSSNVYYLKTLNWAGDTESVLNDVNLLCLDVPLKHNDLLVLSQGRVVPPNHCRINIWQTGSEEIASKLSSVTLSDKSHDEDQVIINDFVNQQYQNYQMIGELIVSNALKLEELEEQIKELMNCSPESESIIRLRFMKKINKVYHQNTNKFQLKKCLIDANKSMKQLGFKQENDLCVQLVAEGDDVVLNQGIILIDCISFDLKTRLCSQGSYKTVAWNVNNGATLNSLKESIVKAYELTPGEVFRMSVAKRLNDKCQWLLLKELAKHGDTSEGTKAKKSKKKSGQGSNATQQQKSNLKASPFNMDDGDLVAFTLESPAGGGQVKAEDFMSTLDLEYSRKSQAEIERLRKERSERKNRNGDDFGSNCDKSKGSRRAEVGITIKIDDFNS